MESSEMVGQPCHHNEVFRPRHVDIFPGSYAVKPPEHISNPVVPGRSGKKASEAADDEIVPRDAILLAPTLGWKEALRDCATPAVWMNRSLWQAGLVEFASSMAFAFVTGAIGVTVQSYPIYVLGPAVFVGNTAAVSLFIYALSSATGAHINPLISFATATAGLCHPVRAAIYILCQAAGSCIGGAFLRAGLGHARALEVHNGGCFLDPNGPMDVGQAAAIEFIASFSLLMVAFGVGLDPRQKDLYGSSLGPLLVGVTVGTMTSATTALNPGYSGAGMFPGRCLGLQVGLGKVYSHDWVWWVPDIAAAIVHAFLYRLAPPYTRERTCPGGQPCDKAPQNGVEQKA